jgi:hypothetical protein
VAALAAIAEEGVMRLLPPSPAGTWVLAAGLWLAGCVAAWQVIPPWPRAVLTEPGQLPVVFSPRGRLLVTCGPSGAGEASVCRFWDAGTGRPHSLMSAVSSRLSYPCFSPDDHWLIVRDVDDPDCQSLWDITRGERVGAIADRRDAVPAFSPTEPLLAWPVAEPDDVRVRLLEVPSLRLRAELPGAREPLAFSPDGRTLATGGEPVGQPPDVGRFPGALDLWDVGTARRTATRRAPFGETWFLTFTPDGRRLVGATGLPYGLMNHRPEEPTAVVWDLPAGRERFRLFGQWQAGVQADRLFTMSPLHVRAIDLNSGQARLDVEYTWGAEEMALPVAAGRWLVVMDQEMSVVQRCSAWLQNHGVPGSGEVFVHPVARLVDADSGRTCGRLERVRAPLLSRAGDTLAVMTNDGETQLYDVPFRPPLTMFAATAAGLAVPIAGLAWRRTRKLRTMA